MNYAKWLWDTLTGISLIVIIIALVIEFFFHPDKHTMEIVHMFDITALSFLFVELVNDFNHAENKRKFVTREWLLIISFLPLGTMIRAGRVFQGSRAVVFASRIWGRLAELLRIEGVGVKTTQSLIHASKIGRVLRPVAEILSLKNKQAEELRARRKKKRKD